MQQILILLLEQEKEVEEWKQMHVGGIEGVSSQHLHLMVTHKFHQKHWNWQEDRRTIFYGTAAKNPTMYIAILDIKTASDVAR